MILELKTFGGLRLEADGAPCGGAAVRPKTLALLALLAPKQDGMSRDKLIAYLWPETDSEHGRNLLKQACNALRRDLQQRELFRGRKFLQLNPAAIAVDVRRFEAALEQGDLSRGIAEYAGEFLDGFYLDGSGEFERWVFGERERLARRASSALQTLAKEASRRADHRTAVESWRRLADLDPLSAEATLGLMTALAAARERAEALKVGREYAELVRRELDAAPARGVVKLMEQLRLQSEEPVTQPDLVPLPRSVAAKVPETAGQPPPPASSDEAVLPPDFVSPSRSAAPEAPETPGQPQPPASVVTPARAFWGRRGAFAAGVLAAAALVAIVIGTPPHSAQAIVAVGTIRVYQGPDSTLGSVVAEMLAANLARLANLQVISTTRLHEIASQMTGGGDKRITINRAASRAGATELLEGALFQRTDGRLRLQLQLIDLRTGVVRRAYVAEDRDPIALVDRVTDQLTDAFAPQPRR